MHEFDIVKTGAEISSARRVLILLHGRGGSPDDMLDLATHFVDDSWHIAAPRATNGTWYPYSFMAPRPQNEPWLGSAIQLVHRLLDETVSIIPADKIHLMGFSQGACLATECAAQMPARYGGIYAFTGGVIGDVLDPSLYTGSFHGTPVYLSNGDNDPHIPQHRSLETKELFEKMDAEVTMEIFPGRPHTITRQEIAQVQRMLAI